jgi:large conductance mechanosensitive channel
MPALGCYLSTFGMGRLILGLWQSSEGNMLSNMLREFRDFAMRGNVVDLAIGVIIGAAFSKIVSSLVDDIIMPVIGALTGGLDFSNYFIPLSKAVTAHVLVEARREGAVFAWGSFLTVAVNFTIVAFVLFLVVRGIGVLRRQAMREEEKPAAPPPRQEVLLEEIRDLLAQR